MSESSMAFWSTIAVAYFLITSTIVHVHSASTNKQCGLHEGNHTVKVSKKDNFGRECRGVVPIVLCGGLCLSSETGTHEFPYSEATISACVPTITKIVTHTLSDCDSEADSSAQVLEYIDPIECGCKRYDALKP